MQIITLISIKRSLSISEASVNRTTLHHTYYILLQVAESKLQLSVDGNFLVRESESAPGEYSLSLTSGGTIHHIRYSMVWYGVDFYLHSIDLYGV